MKEADKKNIRVTVRLDKLTKQRLLAMAKRGNLTLSGFLLFVVRCFLFAYDDKVLTKVSPIPPGDLKELFEINRHNEKSKANGNSFEQEIKQMFSELQEDGAKMAFDGDINKRF